MEWAKKQGLKIKTFCTISPLRNFPLWLEQTDLDSSQEQKALEIARIIGADQTSGKDFILTLLAEGHKGDTNLIAGLSTEQKHGMEGIIKELAVEYLLNHHSETKDLQDGVQKFHMRSGALIGGVQVNLNPAAGQDKVMVNYVRGLERSEERGEAFRKGEVQIASYIIDDIAKHTGAIERLGRLTSHLKDIDNEIVAYQGGK